MTDRRTASAFPSHSAVHNPVLGPRKFYRGWRIILALFLSTLALFGVSIYAFIVLVHPLGVEQGWSAAQTGAAVSAMWLTAPLALLAGPLIKRVGPWRMVVCGLLLQAIAFAALPLIISIETLFLLRLVMGVGKIMLVTAVPVIVATWFSRRFATAMALVWAGGAAGGFLMAPLSDRLLEVAGWQWAAEIIAGLIIVLGAIIGLLARGPKTPADAGTVIDGPKGSDAAAATQPTPAAAEPLPARQAIRQIDARVAVVMLLSVVGIGMASIALLTQEQALLEDAGLSSDLTATYLGMTAVGSLVGSASIGWVLDRFAAKWAGVFIGVSLYAGLLAFAAVPPDGDRALALFAVLSCGFAFGAGEVLWITLTKRQFDTALFATAYGGWYFAMQVGYGSGGGIGGWGYERFGPTGFLLVVALMYLPAAFFSVALRGARVDPENSC